MSDRIDERRRSDRRTYNDPKYTRPDRRVGPRRRATDRTPRSKIGLFGAAIAVFIVADAALWNGQYRHAALSTLHAETDGIRQWSAHVWDMG